MGMSLKCIHAYLKGVPCVKVKIDLQTFQTLGYFMCLTYLGDKVKINVLSQKTPQMTLKI